MIQDRITEKADVNGTTIKSYVGTLLRKVEEVDSNATVTVILVGGINEHGLSSIEVATNIVPESIPGALREIASHIEQQNPMLGESSGPIRPIGKIGQA